MNLHRTPMNTTLHEINPTIALREPFEVDDSTTDLVDRYSSVIRDQRLSWTTHQRLIRRLGKYDFGNYEAYHPEWQRGCDVL